MFGSDDGLDSVNQQIEIVEFFPISTKVFWASSLVVSDEGL